MDNDGHTLATCRRTKLGMEKVGFIRFAVLLVALLLLAVVNLKNLIYQMFDVASVARTTTTTENSNNTTNQTEEPQRRNHDSSNNNDQERKRVRMKRYGSNVEKCSLTVLIMEPRIPYLPKEDVMFRSGLASLGEYLPDDVCFVLQVSSCVMDLHLKQQKTEGTRKTRHNVPNPNGWKHVPYLVNITDISGNNNDDDDSVHDNVIRDAIVKNVYEKSSPSFRKRMDDGRVRITFLDHNKYNFPDCMNFYNPNRAWLNYHYYVDEFVNGIDSDLVLFFERDAVLCRKISGAVLEKWRKYAYVGAPWPPWNIVPRRKNVWQNGGRFHKELVNRTWNKYWEEALPTTPLGVNGSSSSDQQPSIATAAMAHWNPQPFPSAEKMFPYRCLSGNGGLSFRSRKWMRRAIRTCPHAVRSGLNQTVLNETNCTVMMEGNPWNDDAYFSHILPLIGAPLPSTFIASLFSSDGPLPDTILHQETAGLVDEQKPAFISKEEQERLAEILG